MPLLAGQRTRDTEKCQIVGFGGATGEHDLVGGDGCSCVVVEVDWCAHFDAGTNPAVNVTGSRMTGFIVGFFAFGLLLCYQSC